jgi:hypothetical protein
VLPIAAWELSVGVYLTVKGFNRPVVAEGGEVEAPVASLSTAAA